MVPAAGVAADLGHVERKSVVRGYEMIVGGKPIDNLKECLTGCHLVLVPAGLPRKPGMTRDDLFKVNAGIALGLVEACAKFCPDAVLGLIVNPVNSVVPAMCEYWKSKGLDPKKIVGVSTLDVVRANKFVQEITGRPAEIPVIGGHAGATILPLFSQDPAGATIDASKIPDLDKRVQDAGTEVVKAKNGKGSATLSMAYAGARLGSAVLSGLAGVEVTECAYVESNVTELPYFASKVTFGKEGIKTVHPLGPLSPHESKRLQEMMPTLREEINDGIEYAKKNSFSKEGPTAGYKVCVVGGAGGIGQPLALLMSKEKNVKEVVIIDLNVAMVPAEGVAADLSHLEGKAKVTSRALVVNQDKAIEKAGDVLAGCDLVLVPAGVPRKPGQDRKDLLDINCGIAKGTVEACAKFCPNAVLGLIVNPVNSVVPAMCEMWKKAGLDPRKIVGVTTLDCVRADKFVHEVTGKAIEGIDVPVIGGHAGTTILPLFSQDSAARRIPAERVPDLDRKVQDAGTVVVQAKNGKGSAT